MWITRLNGARIQFLAQNHEKKSGRVDDSHSHINSRDATELPECSGDLVLCRKLNADRWLADLTMSFKACRRENRGMPEIVEICHKGQKLAASR
jgi:hypothetical protein